MPLKPRKSRYPLESFDPRYKNIWLQAILSEVRLDFPSEKEAAAFQARLQLYRAKYRDSGAEDAKALYRAKTSLQGKTLLIRPTDLVHAAVLGHFNTTVAVPPPDTVVTDLDSTTTKPLSVDDIFADFKETSND